eukprot:scaffold320120_cov10-Tisochrysis_lutea.AAC.1
MDAALACRSNRRGRLFCLVCEQQVPSSSRCLQAGFGVRAAGALKQQMPSSKCLQTGFDSCMDAVLASRGNRRGR